MKTKYQHLKINKNFDYNAFTKYRFEFFFTIFFYSPGKKMEKNKKLKLKSLLYSANTTQNYKLAVRDSLNQLTATTNRTVSVNHLCACMCVYVFASSGTFFCTALK